MTSRLAVELGNHHWEVNSPGVCERANLLKLNCEKAFRATVGATLGLTETISFTAEWYRNFYDENIEALMNFLVIKLMSI